MEGEGLHVERKENKKGPLMGQHKRELCGQEGKRIRKKKKKKKKKEAKRKEKKKSKNACPSALGQRLASC